MKITPWYVGEFCDNDALVGILTALPERNYIITKVCLKRIARFDHDFMGVLGDEDNEYNESKFCDRLRLILPCITDLIWKQNTDDCLFFIYCCLKLICHASSLSLNQKYICVTEVNKFKIKTKIRDLHGRIIISEVSNMLLLVVVFDHLIPFCC